MSFDQFLAVIRAFEREAVDYILVGGVATPATLVRMKQDTVRARDHADAALLRRRFSLGEEG